MILDMLNSDDNEVVDLAMILLYKEYGYGIESMLPEYKGGWLYSIGMRTAYILPDRTYVFTKDKTFKILRYRLGVHSIGIRYIYL